MISSLPFSQRSYTLPPLRGSNWYLPNSAWSWIGTDSHEVFYYTRPGNRYGFNTGSEAPPRCSSASLRTADWPIQIGAKPRHPS
jgi:hypothetical protein